LRLGTIGSMWRRPSINLIGFCDQHEYRAAKVGQQQAQSAGKEEVL
jgi:hypothetical protein